MIFVRPSQIWWRRGNWSRGKDARGGDLLRYAFSWVLTHTDALYIVKSDVDAFVCPLHLQCVLQSLPKKRLFYASFNTGTNSKHLPPSKNLPQRVKDILLRPHNLCRADQDFMAFSRDLLSAALLFFNTTRSWLPSQNWAYGNFGRYLRFSWARSNATVFDDHEGIIGPRVSMFQGKPMQQILLQKIQHAQDDSILGQFCSRHVFGHLIAKDVQTVYRLY